MKVLLAVDGSRYSEAALEAMVTQRNPRDTEVLVTHVVAPISVTPPPQMAAGYTPELQNQVEEAEKLVERCAKRLREAGFRAATEVRKGDVREEIIDAAAKWGADKIVLGSHGRSGIQWLLLGSVAEFVARHAKCSVEIVRNRTA
ncbi:MAG TPA: universal stress protein [Candidatus Acidoferrales bacterium]|nr:universal stress protein [Candidatus Acidoferrales bacterium]